MSVLDSSTVCAGNPDPRFVTMAESKKGKFLTSAGEARATTESAFPVWLNGERYTTTIRTTSCEILTRGVKCSVCNDYRGQLLAAYSRFVRKTATTDF